MPKINSQNGIAAEGDLLHKYFILLLVLVIRVSWSPASLLCGQSDTEE